MRGLSGLKRNFGYQMVYRILLVVTPLITSPYLARVLGVEALGQYSASQAFVNYFILFAMLGIENYGNRTVARVQDDKWERSAAFWNIYIIQVIATCCSIAAFLLLVEMLIKPEVRLVYLMQGLWLIDSLLNINWFFWGCEQFKLTVTRNIVIKIASIAGILLFVKSPRDLWIYVMIVCMSGVLAEGSLWFFLPRYIEKPKVQWQEVLQNVAPILQLFIPVLASSVFHIMDKTMLNILSNDANSGYYYNADKIINVPLQLITGMSAVMLPRVANTLHTEGSGKVKELLSKSAELTLFLTCAIAFGIGAISDSFVPFFFGDGYEPCILLIKVFVPVLIIKALSDFVRGQYLIPTGKDKIYTIAVFGGALSNVVANYILIRQYGALGATIGTLIAEFIVLVIQVVGAKKDLPLKEIIGTNGIYIVFGIIMFAVVAALSLYMAGSGIVKVAALILAGAVVYMLLCVGYWRINKKSIFARYVTWNRK